MELSEDTARRFARIALGHVAREYPHKLDHVMIGDEDALPPRTLHPCFFGSFDWHSCVHGWWTLLTLRRLFPDTDEAGEIETLARSTFSESNLAAELAYAQRPSSRGFERPYGWGWLLYLHLETQRHPDQPWGTRIEPLARHFADMLRGYLSIMTYPITTGTHYNTAFALVLAREWAQVNDANLLNDIDGWSERAFGHRSEYGGWEPGGDEFLSPVLTAALLMSRVRPGESFELWLRGLILSNRWLERHGEPVTVSDRTDGKIAHLDGLSLSRAWCLRSIAVSMERNADGALLRSMADRNMAAGLDHVAGDYMGEHWLASFALLAMLADQGPNTKGAPQA